jgi:hypothetical protein
VRQFDQLPGSTQPVGLNFASAAGQQPSSFKRVGRDQAGPPPVLQQREQGGVICNGIQGIGVQHQAAGMCQQRRLKCSHGVAAAAARHHGGSCQLGR